jgi:uncharacterized protein YrrD
MHNIFKIKSLYSITNKQTMKSMNGLDYSEQEDSMTYSILHGLGTSNNLANNFPGKKSLALETINC